MLTSLGEPLENSLSTIRHLPLNPTGVFSLKYRVTKLKGTFDPYRIMKFANPMGVSGKKCFSVLLIQGVRLFWD